MNATPMIIAIVPMILMAVAFSENKIMLRKKTQMKLSEIKGYTVERLPCFNANTSRIAPMKYISAPNISQ